MTSQSVVSRVSVAWSTAVGLSGPRSGQARHEQGQRASAIDRRHADPPGRSGSSGFYRTAGRPAGMKAKIRYTVRELSNRGPERRPADRIRVEPGRGWLLLVDSR